MECSRIYEDQSGVPIFTTSELACVNVQRYSRLEPITLWRISYKNPENKTDLLVLYYVKRKNIDKTGFFIYC